MKTKFAKVFAVLAALALIISSVITAFAAKTVTLKVDILGQDGVVYVRLTAPEGSDIATFSSTVSFDTSKLSYNAVNYISGDSILTMTNDADAANGVVTANLVLADSLTEEAKIVTYAFNLLDGAEGKIAFDFTNIAATDSNDEPIDITFDKDVSINISDIEPLPPEENDESTTEDAVSEEPTTEAEGQNAESPSIPGTSGRTIAIVSAVGVIVVAAAAGTVIYTVRRKKIEE
ncbi:MAG: hypothetical protein J1F23_03395 [Oscillospiraceae bacterium]|nr:hypothetical protein [Oscillospiraceae bacterium]